MSADNVTAGLDLDRPQRVTDTGPDAPTYDCRQAFAETLIDLARLDDRIVAVCNDSVGSSNLGGFQKEFPDRLINVGIAEQDLVGVAAGLANGGLIPYVSAAGPFLTGRALEQIKVDVAYSNARVVLCGQSPGMSYGELGPTHHSIEDLSWLRAVAGLPIVVPADPRQTSAAVRWAALQDTGSYLRIGRFKVPATTPASAPFATGKAIELVPGDDAAILAVGTLVPRAIEAARVLAEDGVHARVVNMTFVSPIDVEAVLSAAVTGAVVTAEEATVSGGLGAGVASLLSQRRPTRMRILGVVNEFAPTGSANYLLAHFGLTVEGLVRAVREVRQHGQG